MSVERINDHLENLTEQVAAYEARVCACYKKGLFLRAAYPAKLDSSDSTTTRGQIVQALAGRPLYPDTIENLIALAENYDFPYEVVFNPQTHEIEIYFPILLGYGREALYPEIATDLEEHPEWKSPQLGKGFCTWKEIPTAREPNEYKNDRTETIQFLEALGIKFRISFHLHESHPQTTFLVEQEALTFLTRVEQEASHDDYHQIALLVDSGTTPDNVFYQDYVAARARVVNQYGPIRSSHQ